MSKIRWRTPTIFQEKNRKGQEEMVGFVLIVIIVSVIMVILLGFLLKSPESEAVQSYEIENFLSAVLQYSSSCEDYLGYLDVEHLIVSCNENEDCLDERSSCEALNNTLKDLIETSWNVGETSPVKGYVMKIIIEDEEKLVLEEGNKTGDYKGGFQDFARKGTNYEISFSTYYD